jgi:hypothetical protein
MTAPGVILLFDARDQLAGSDSAERLLEAKLKFPEQVHALCFPAGIRPDSFRLARRRQIARGLVEVSFSPGKSAPEQIEQIEELRVLQRWLEQILRDAGDRPDPAKRTPSGPQTRQRDDDSADGSSGASDVERRIQLRERLRKQVPLLTADTWARLAGNRGKNPSAALGKYKSAGRLFAVTDGNRDLYPAFQFSEADSRPKDTIATVLEHVPLEARGWPLLSWFNAPNVFLGNQKPLEAIDSDPDAVAEAADRFYGRDD